MLLDDHHHHRGHRGEIENLLAEDTEVLKLAFLGDQ
jgi:hypothetical protein